MQAPVSGEGLALNLSVAFASMALSEVSLFWQVVTV
jgi:hypothetical protein